MWGMGGWTGSDDQGYAKALDRAFGISANRWEPDYRPRALR